MMVGMCVEIEICSIQFTWLILFVSTRLLYATFFVRRSNWTYKTDFWIWFPLIFFVGRIYFNRFVINQILYIFSLARYYLAQFLNLFSERIYFLQNIFDLFIHFSSCAINSVLRYIIELDAQWAKSMRFIRSLELNPWPDIMMVC